jgi:hypothetical protein
MPPTEATSSRKLEKFFVYILLVLGVALFGAGITSIGVVTTSGATVGIGAGTIAAAGLLSIVFAVLGFSPDVNEDAEIFAQTTNSTPPLVQDIFVADQHPRRPSRTTEPLQAARRLPPIGSLEKGVAHQWAVKRHFLAPE